MRVKKIIFLLVFCFLSFICVADDVFGYGTWVGIVKNNTVQFFTQNKRSWENVTISEIVLTAGYKNVFGVGAAIGVIYNDTIQFFVPNKTYTAFERASNMDMSLSEGYKSVFGGISGAIGVAYNNTIQFFQKKDSHWEHIPFLDFVK